MGKVATKFLSAFLILFSYVSLTYAAAIESPFNGLTLDLDETVEEYTFLLGGHLYGKSVFPVSSLLANIDMINSSGAKFFISLGDNFQRTDTLHITHYQKSFASKLRMPLFNAVGNHDVENRELYEANFGNTYYYFVYNNELFLFLDSELDDGNIVDDQLVFFLYVTQAAIKNPEIKHVFIFSHKLIWAVNNPDYQIVFEHANHQYPDNNFKNELEPILIELSKDKAVYWISGDVGISRSLPLFFEKAASPDITYVAVGMADSIRDAMLQVNISQSSGVIFTPISLTGQELLPIEDYGLSYWQTQFDSETNNIETVFVVYRDKLSQMLQHKYFWIGVLAGLPFFSLIVLLPRRLRGS
jgi:hypothetical protein